MTWILGHVFAVCIGISLGLLGGGGSVLALPVLVYVMTARSGLRDGGCAETSDCHDLNYCGECEFVGQHSPCAARQSES